MASPRRQPTPEDIRFADNLCAARRRAGLTQEKVAEILGITNQAVNQWEAAKTRPKGSRLDAVMKLYSTNYDALIGSVIDGTWKADVPQETRPVLYSRPEEARIDDDLSENTVDDFNGLRIEGEVAAGLWIEVHNDIENDSAHHDIYDPVPVAIDHRWRREYQFGLIVRGTSINRVATDGDVLTCVSVHGTNYDPQKDDLVIVEQRRDAGLLIERTAKRWLEARDHYELWPDSTDPRWQSPIIVSKRTGFDAENEDGIAVSLKAFVTWVHRPMQVPVRRKR